MIRLRYWPVLCLLGLALALPVDPAKAQDDKPGLYASLSGMYVVPLDVELAVPGGTVDLIFENGLGFQGALGYSLGSGLRAEFEIGYRRNDMDEVGGVKLDAEYSALSFMLNGFFDFSAGGVRPYVGGGFGAVRQEAEIEVGSVTVGGETASVSLSESDTDMAFQGMIGVGYPLSDRAIVHLGYRYFHILEDESYTAHNFEAGVRFSF